MSEQFLYQRIRWRIQDWIPKTGNTREHYAEA